jgi:hypothetical protein
MIDVLEIINRVPKPAWLYHYTDPSGLVGISSSKTLWAGRVYDLNDSAEQQQIYVDFDALLERFYSRGKDPRNRRGVIAQLDALKDMSARVQADLSLLPPIYTVSLTDQPDSLEQFRGYCPRSGGVALGFSGSDLTTLGAAQGFTLARCSYSVWSDAELLIDKVLVHCTYKIHGPNAGEASSEDLEVHAEEFAREVFHYLALIAPIFKHWSFSSEQEWRLISGPASFSELIPRPTATGLKLYLPFKLTSEDVGIDSVKCTIGPNVNPLAMESATRVVLEREFRRVDIDRTETPYR